MAGGAREPQGEAAGGIPDGAKLFELTEFKGLNTRSPRMSIDDEEMSWCENFFPIAKGNLSSLYDQGSPIYTAPSGKTVVYFFHYNIGATQYCAVFLSDGTAYQINVATTASTTISAVASTFYAGTTLPVCQQYGNQFLLIANTNTANDYWIWDGVVLYGYQTLAPALSTWITNGGSGYTPGTYALGISAGTATGTYTVGVAGTVISIKITNSGSGYTTAPTLSFPSGGGSSAAATAVLMPVGVSGNALEVFTNRVHLSDQAKVLITDPESLTAFNTTITSTDSFLKNQFVALKQTNGFIYLFADSSVNDITNEQTAGSPAVTTLNNSNADPQVGTPWRDSVVAFGRDLVFANTNGIYVMYGGAAEKISEKLDGLFKTATLPITGNAYPSAAVATIFGIKVYMILITIVDIFSGVLTPKLLCWDGKKWFIASQAATMTFIGTQEVSSQLTAWGTDGMNVFPLFQTKSLTLQKKGQTKLWQGESFLIFKQALRAYIESFSNDQQVVSVSATIDSDSGNSASISLPGGNLLLNIVNGSNVLFITNGGQNYYIVNGGTSIQGVDAQQYGRLLGLTFTSTGDDFTIVALALLYRNQTFYG